MTTLEVRTASTAEELEAIQRFRYGIYVEEMGRYLGTADHEHPLPVEAEGVEDGHLLVLPWQFCWLVGGAARQATTPRTLRSMIASMSKPSSVRISSPCSLNSGALVGAAGSGKSTWAAEHYRDVEVVSSDALRAVLGSGTADLDATADAFRLLDQVVELGAGTRDQCDLEAAAAERAGDGETHAWAGSDDGDGGHGEPLPVE